MNNIEDRFPQILKLNPQELIEWCKKRKKERRLTNQKLSELSRVPVGTIDRIMSGNYSEYKYSSVQPLVSVLLSEDGDDSEEETCASDGSAEMPESYRQAFETQTREIEALKKEFASLTKQVQFMEQENINKQKQIELMEQHIIWLRKMIDKQNEN